MQELYRGVWADHLQHGTFLPVGGSMFSPTLTHKMELDFDHFKDAWGASHPNSRVATKDYKSKEKGLKTWLRENKLKMDPYLFYITNSTMNVVRHALDIKAGEAEGADMHRRVAYGKEGGAKLSASKGVAMCAEQAALAQHILQKVLRKGYTAHYMSGVTSHNGEDVENHSWIVIKRNGRDHFIFDIARPHAQGLARVLRSEHPLSPELFAGQENLLVKAHDVFGQQPLYFGVGNPMETEDCNILPAPKRRAERVA